jgi:hypothetical protein
MKHLAVVLAAALAALPARASAQEPHLPTHGERVRIAQRDGPTVTGTVDQVTSDHISLLPDGNRQGYVIPQGGVARVERSAGRERRFAKYFALGVASTSVAGGILAATTWSPCRSTGFMSCMFTPGSRSEALAWGLIAGGAVGVPVGLVAGMSVREERWVPVTLPGAGELSLSVIPDRQRPGFAVSIPTGAR